MTISKNTHLLNLFLLPVGLLSDERRDLAVLLHQHAPDFTGDVALALTDRGVNLGICGQILIHVVFNELLVRRLLVNNLGVGSKRTNHREITRQIDSALVRKSHLFERVSKR